MDADDDDGGGAPFRSTPGWRIWVEESLDATGLGLRVALLGAAGIGIVLGALWWLSREAPVPVDAALPLVDVAAVTTTTSPPADVVVHVAGAVARPGVHRLPAGSRVIDAVEASGGTAPDADPGRINLAATLTDGQQVFVPVVGEPVPASSTPDGDGPVDLNTADAGLLESLPGVGPATAAAIIEHRDRHGPFGAVDDLLLVRGIGEAKLAALRDRVTV